MIEDLKSFLETQPNIKILEDQEGLLVSFRSLYVTKRFGCQNTCYVSVRTVDGPLIEVETYPKDLGCSLWDAVDKEINIGLIQGYINK